MKHRIVCDKDGCTIERKRGIWPFIRWQRDKPFSLYGHSYEMRWPDRESALNYLKQQQ